MICKIILYKESEESQRKISKNNDWNIFLPQDWYWYALEISAYNLNYHQLLKISLVIVIFVFFMKIMQAIIQIKNFSQAFKGMKFAYPEIPN